MYENVQICWQYANTATYKSDQKRLARLWRSSRDFDLVTGKLALRNYADVEGNRLKPYETRVYLWR